MPHAACRMPHAACRMPKQVLRVSYSANPASLPDWKRVGNGRFDDPQRAYRVLYTSASRFGAFIERFQDFRPNEEMRATDADFEWEDDNSSLRYQNLPSGTLTFPEYGLLNIGEYTADTEAIIMDLTVDATARMLGAQLKVPGLTIAAIIGDDPQSYTLSRRITRIGYEHQPPFVGILSASKLHPTQVRNVSLYEGDNEDLRTRLHPTKVETLNQDDGSFREACGFLGITVQQADEYFSRQFSFYGP
jgi:RES domain